MAVEIRKISSGHEEIDNAHKLWVELTTAIDAACESGDTGGVSNEAMLRLLDISRVVFELEEAAMAMEDLGYLKSGDHIEEHEILISTIKSAMAKVGTGASTLIKEAVGTMVFCIAGHVETMDVPLADQISKKIRRPAAPTRRMGEPAARPITPHAGGGGVGGGARRAPAGKTGDDGVNLRTIIVNTYTATLLDLKISRGMTGEGAKNVAYEVTARVINKSVGKKINGDFVKQIILSQ